MKRFYRNFVLLAVAIPCWFYYANMTFSPLFSVGASLPPSQVAQFFAEPSESSSAGFYYPSNYPGFEATYWWVGRDAVTNSSVMTVPDRMGTGLDLTNTAGSTSPSRMAADVNGLDTLFFDGSNDYLQQNMVAMTQPFTIAWTMHVTNEAANQTIISATNNAILNLNTTISDMNINAGTAMVRGSITNAFVRWLAVVNGASSQIWTNGVQSGATGNAGVNALAGMWLFRTSGGFYARGRMAELSMHPGAFDSTTISNDWNYTTNIYGTADFGIP